MNNEWKINLIAKSINILRLINKYAIESNENVGISLNFLKKIEIICQCHLLCRVQTRVQSLEHLVILVRYAELPIDRSKTFESQHSFE